ncbi:IAA-amino acid hydrolase ILR1-like [Musa troglodytarum]|uniref:IAA-amino acid hydrolase ILR1-like n=1 Tax=Musa troglodytarum TaxID=320322 RepID=A0A9E7KYK9_9LILI|nr:IAA-amino acid hydrolase ILR1-like [Musa troglodytarum]
MAGWISSKLKIDQQAAESLGKSESSRSPYDGLPQEIPKKVDPSRPLKHQLPTKSWPSPPPPPDIGRPVSVPPSPANSEPSVAEEDWTELLSSADPAGSLPRPNGGAKKPTALLLPAGKGVRGGSGGLVKPARRSDVAASEGETVKNVSGDREEPSASAGLRPSRRSSSFLDLTKELFKQEFQGGGDDRSRALGSDIDSKKLDVKEGVEFGDDSKSRSNEDTKPAGIALRASGSRDEARSSLESDEESSDSTSASDSDEEERQKREERRRRKEQINAERIAAVAAEAIREREDIVARLEGEKQSLEKILEEREKKQAEEASELQMSMIEAMEAVEREKQKHNSTMMEALACLAELEGKKVIADNECRACKIAGNSSNASGKSEDRRNLSKIHQRGPSIEEVESLRRSQFKQEILDAEYSFTCDKLSKLKDKVEALSSEKATLVLRIEQATGFADNHELASSLEAIDIEAGTQQPSVSALRPAIRDKIRTGQKQLGSVIQQLDFVFSIGVIYLRRNKKAQTALNLALSTL